MTDLRELRRLEPWFYRAPSAHNAQPWLLGYEPDRIELRFDPRRHLDAADPTRRDLFLSLGALVEAVLITSASARIPLDFVPSISGEEVGSFVPGADPYNTAYGLQDLERRQTSRVPYSGRPAGGELAAVRAQLRAGERLHELAASDVLDLFTAADLHLYESRPVVAELRSWLRLSKRDPRYEEDGLTYECLALSRLEAFGLALLLRPVIFGLARALGVARLLTASARSVLEDEGTVLVLEGPADEPAELLASGRSLLRAWLALAAVGCATHPLSQILDYAETERELAERLRVAPGNRLLSVFRAGRSGPAARSHRLVKPPTGGSSTREQHR